MKCSICNKEFSGHGNNAQPINNGMCCDECNSVHVISARLKAMRESSELKNGHD